MDDNVGDVGLRLAYELLDLAGAGMGVVEGRLAVEAEREERDEAVGGPQKAQLARRAAGRLAHDALDGARVEALLARLGELGERLEMRLHRVELRYRVEDRTL